MAIPLTVPVLQESTYRSNLDRITKKHAKKPLFLFAADQKMEHLHTDFYGPGISPDAEDPEHLFKIAAQSEIGAFATHLGLVARYGHKYPNIPYIIKLNGKSNLVGLGQNDPRSTLLQSVEDIQVVADRVPVVGVGYTIYLGSLYEAQMLHEAAHMVLQAHARGLVAVLWIYPRGKALQGVSDPLLVAGAAGVGLSLGADFVKVTAPQQIADLTHAVRAAGDTGVICSGGAHQDADVFLRAIQAQQDAGARGCAVGRNIFQRSFNEAVDLCAKISAIVYR